MKANFINQLRQVCFIARGVARGWTGVDISLDLASPLFIARNGVLDDEMNEKNEK